VKLILLITSWQILLKYVKIGDFDFVHFLFNWWRMMWMMRMNFEEIWKVCFSLLKDLHNWLSSIQIADNLISRYWITFQRNGWWLWTITRLSFRIRLPRRKCSVNMKWWWIIRLCWCGCGCGYQRLSDRPNIVWGEFHLQSTGNPPRWRRERTAHHPWGRNCMGGFGRLAWALKTWSRKGR
jgi:hypothetical protein